MIITGKRAINLWFVAAPGSENYVDRKIPKLRFGQKLEEERGEVHRGIGSTFPSPDHGPKCFAVVPGLWVQRHASE